MLIGVRGAASRCFSAPPSPIHCSLSLPFASDVTARFVPLLWEAMASKGVSGPNDDIDWPYETIWPPKCFEKRF